MEAPEEAIGSNDHTQIIKGKRTKRQRAFSQQAILMTDSSSSEGGDNYTIDLSPATSAELAAAESSTEEEEDMANCLILLAQGQTRDGSKRIGEGSRRFPQAAATATDNGGFYIYECKTCNRSFPSFQALGGHRASHKKPKSIMEEKKIFMGFEDEGKFNNNFPPFALRIGNRVLCNNNNKSRVHECSICGSEFSSGQALGGHMRRHRTFISPSVNTIITSEVSQEQAMKTRNVLSLDLNLPAPEEDEKFPFVSKQPPLVFSASALVDCHY